MDNSYKIKRKHFRFPAFDDEIGVKIKEDERTLFNGEEDILTTHDVEKDLEKYVRRSRKSTAKKAGQSLQHREELEEHRANLPRYDQQRSFSQKKTTQQKRLFEEKPVQSIKTAAPEKKQTVIKKTPTSSRGFVPKYVPASILPDKEENGITDKNIEYAMKKPQSDYLLFENGYVPYQEDPVTKFPEEPIQKGLETASGKKSTRLDRSLRGIMTEGNETLEKTKYFDQ